MKKVCLIFFIVIFSLVLLKTNQVYGWTDADGPCPDPSNTCTQEINKNHCQHIIAPFSCYDPGNENIDFLTFMAYFGDSDDELGYNTINIDDHPNGVGGINTVQPGQTLNFSAPDAVLSQGAKVRGIWLRQHDNEDDANYRMDACNVNESGDS